MMEKLKFLPPMLLKPLSKLDYGRLYEIRIRADKPVRVCYGGKFFYLLSDGILKEKIDGILTKTNDTSPVNIVLNAQQVSEIVFRAAEFSIYAVNGQISSGYITMDGGIRLGVAGEVVYEGDFVKTQKNFNSLVIRIPHQIVGAADKAFAALNNSGNKNLLLISPPGCGKTTILRDLCRQISDAGANTLLVDERSEIAACHDGVAMLDVGKNTDVISGARKEYAFSFGIRSLRPDYIITDEIAGASDIEAVRRAALSGVNVIASMHARGLKDIESRAELSAILSNKIFGRYVFLSLKNGAGTYESILDENFNAAASNNLRQVY